MRKSRTTRDIGLRQVKTTTKWIAGAAALLAGLITVWDTQAVSHASASTPKGTPPATASSTDGSGTSDSGYSDPGSTTGTYSDPGSSSGYLQTPDTVPAPSNDIPSARSGGS